MATQQQSSNKEKTEELASMNSLTDKDELSLTKEEKRPGVTKPATKAKGHTRAASKKAAPKKTVSKTFPTEKETNTSFNKVVKTAIASSTESDSANKTKGRVGQEKNTQEKTSGNKPKSPLRYGVDSGEIIANRFIHANSKVCMFWLDALTQYRKTNLEKMVLVEAVGQLADETAQGLLEASTDHAHNTVQQATEIANAGVSIFEGMHMENLSLFDFEKVLPFKIRI